jgi:hypothetical protein
VIRQEMCSKWVPRARCRVPGARPRRPVRRATTTFSNRHIAAYLVRKGMPFRTAHETVGGMVRELIATSRDFADLTLGGWRRFSALFDRDNGEVKRVRSGRGQHVFRAHVPRGTWHVLPTVSLSVLASRTNILFTGTCLVQPPGPRAKASCRGVVPGHAPSRPANFDRSISKANRQSSAASRQ